MKKAKRILALILVLTLAVTSLAMFASASEADIEELRAYACPVCGIRTKTETQTVMVEQDILLWCPNFSGPHTHTVFAKIRTESCTNSACGYKSTETLSTWTECYEV